MTTAMTDAQTLIAGLHVSTPQAAALRDGSLLSAPSCSSARPGTSSSSPTARSPVTSTDPGAGRRSAAVPESLARVALRRPRGTGLEAPLFVHRDDAAETEERLHVRGTFSRAPHLRGRLRGDPDPGPHPRRHGLPVGYGRAPAALHRRQRLPARRRVGCGRARLKRPRALYREPRTDAGARLRRPRPLGRERRAALLHDARRGRGGRRLRAVIDRLRRGENG